MIHLHPTNAGDAASELTMTCYCDEVVSGNTNAIEFTFESSGSGSAESRSTGTALDLRPEIPDETFVTLANDLFLLLDQEEDE